MYIFIFFQVVTGKGFEVPRRVYVDFEGINLRKKFLTGIEPEFINMTIGKTDLSQFNAGIKYTLYQVLNLYYLLFCFLINSPSSRLSADSETRCFIRAFIQWEDVVSCGLSVSHHCHLKNLFCYMQQSRMEVTLVTMFFFFLSALFTFMFLWLKFKELKILPLLLSFSQGLVRSSPFCRCSRLYWSTMDPRRRCRYTCKVTEVSTPLPGEEQDPRWDKEENHTIVHSPTHHRGQ